MIGESNIKENKNFEQITEMVFSSAMSLFISLMINGFYDNYYICSAETHENCECAITNPWLIFLIGISIYIAVFFLTKFIYRFLSRKIQKHYLQYRINPIDVSREKAKELIDDFDNIAFDHLLIPYDYIEQINVALAKNRNEIATFYFFETLYYLRTSILKTKQLLFDKRREMCLNIKGKTDGVDVFRLFNAYKMMQEVFKNIKNLTVSQPDIMSSCSEDLRKEIEHQINMIEKDIQYIGEQCTRASNDLKAV